MKPPISALAILALSCLAFAPGIDDRALIGALIRSVVVGILYGAAVLILLKIMRVIK